MILRACTEINFAKSEKLSYNKKMEKNRMIAYFEEVEKQKMSTMDTITAWEKQ